MSAGASPVRAEVAVLRPASPDGAGITSAAKFVIAPDERAFTGHYPGLPLFPGVCVVECAHRSSLATMPRPEGGSTAPVRLAEVKSARFRTPVFPGDELTVRIVWSTEPGGWTCAAGIRNSRGEVARAALRYSSAPAPEPPLRPTPWPPRAEAPSMITPTSLITPAEIQRLMPHRYPMLLVDRVKEIVPGDRIVAVKAITYTDIWYGQLPASVTPDQLAYPTTLLVESWLQAAGVLITWDRPNPDPLAGEVMLLGGLTNIRFYRPVLPGDVVEHRVRLLRAHTDAMVFDGESLVGDAVSLTVERVSLALRPPHAVRPDAA
jgi:3-hydroxymyristoyl/3-hydroxydecanoyl-(acyl carrier protein) dehydratase